MIGIYKITNPTGKIYIGQSRNLIQRFRDYRANSESLKKQKALYRSFKKYGVEAHDFQIQEECELEQLDEFERYWQEYYDVCNSKKGLNCLYVHVKRYPTIISKATRLKISKSMTGRKHSAESIEKMRTAQRNKGPMSQETKAKISATKKRNLASKPPRIHTEETKAKISAAHMGKTVNPEIIEKMRQANLGKPGTPWSEERKQAFSLKKKGLKNSPEHIANSIAGRKRAREQKLKSDKI